MGGAGVGTHLPSNVVILPDAEARFKALDQEWLNRRQFMEVFTDTTVIRGKSEFLSLPQLVFDAFEDRKHHPGLVSGLEVLLAMSMFCYGCPAAVQLRTITDMCVSCMPWWWC